MDASNFASDKVLMQDKAHGLGEQGNGRPSKEMAMLRAILCHSAFLS